MNRNEWNVCGFKIFTDLNDDDDIQEHRYLEKGIESYMWQNTEKIFLIF